MRQMGRVVAVILLTALAAQAGPEITFVVRAPKGQRVELQPVLVMTAAVEQETGQKVEDKAVLRCTYKERVTQMTLPSGERLPVRETVFDCGHGVVFRMVGPRFTEEKS